MNITEIYRFITKEELLVIAVFLLIVFLRGFYIYLMRKAIYRQHGKNGTDSTPLSVIIYACNDADNLKSNLKAILKQDYPEFEVIVLNDGSTDDTNDLLKYYERDYPNLYHTYLPEEAKTQSRKKMGLNVAIKAAHYDWIVMTTANSKPASNQWLKTLARNIDSETDIVLAYSGIKSEKKGGLYFRLSNLIFQIKYLAAARIGKPYMGVGNNLAVRKEVFKQRLFHGILNLPFGEDDIPVNRIANKQNTSVELSPESVVNVYYSDLALGWKERTLAYAGARKYYTQKGYRIWSSESLFRILFWGILIYSACMGYFANWLYSLIFFKFALCYYLFLYFSINRIGKQFGEPRFGLTLLKRELFQLFIDLYYKKKGRKYTC
ncbi:MAG: glycosyltransferase [Bacteroidales bacterium]